MPGLIGYVIFVAAIVILALEIHAWITKQIPYTLLNYLNEVVQPERYFRYQILSGLLLVGLMIAAGVFAMQSNWHSIPTGALGYAGVILFQDLRAKLAAKRGLANYNEYHEESFKTTI